MFAKFETNTYKVGRLMLLAHIICLLKNPKKTTRINMPCLNTIIRTRALLRLERTMNLLGWKGGEGRMGERGWGGDGGRVGREGGEGTWGREGGWGEREGEGEREGGERGRVGREGG